MNPLSVRLLLLRFVLVPVIALGALVGGLAYSAHRLNLLVKQGDTTDEIMLHGSDLMRLFVDEETGVRGFLLEKKPAMLEPYQQAGPRVSMRSSMACSRLRRRIPIWSAKSETFVSFTRPGMLTTFCWLAKKRRSHRR